MTAKEFRKIATNNTINFINSGKQKNIIKSDNFCTYGIKTCTGGGLINKLQQEAVGFHLWDCLSSNDLDNYLKIIKNSLKNVSNGLIIGSKNLIDSKFSIKNFQKTHAQLKEICPEISYFKTFTDDFGSANFKYLANEDTWYILLQKTSPNTTNNRVQSITTLRELKNFFKEIYIAPTDTLIINGTKIQRSKAIKIKKRN